MRFLDDARRGLVLSLLFLLTTATLRAAVPMVLDYQGFLTEDGGSPVNEAVLVTFSIYDVPAAGAALWSETLLVTVDQGLFSVRLGEVLPLPAGLADAPRYIGVTVESDGEMVPRRQITASMFALAASDADQLDGEPPSTYDQRAHVTDTGNPHNVTAAQTGAASDADFAAHAGDASAHHTRYTNGEAVGAVLAADGPGSGLSADLLDGLDATQFVQQGEADAISASMIQANAVGSSEIATNAVGSAEIAAAAVGASEIATGAVGSLEIATGAVGSPEILDDSVTGTDLDFGTSGFNHTDSDLNGGIWSMTNTANGSSGNSPFGVLGQAGGAPGVYRVIGVGGLSPGLGVGTSLSDLPTGVRYGVVGAVNNGIGMAALTQGGIGLYADGTQAATKGVGINGPTNGYSGVQGTTDYDGITTLDISGFEIGLLGVSSGATISDNYGVYGFSNNVGVFSAGARLAGEFVGTVKVRKNGETTIDGNRIVVDSKASGTRIVIDADAGPVGRITAGEFVVTGGADFAERFDVAAGSSVIEAGTVLSIDPDRPGSLGISREAYDRKVAGIVSGAGGVRPGMLMGQPGSLADGDYPVALSGRVYVKADAGPGAIRPGDLLTTSALSGHAMRVDDHARASGAVIGKAMTGLERGTGLVLVLVSLQ